MGDAFSVPFILSWFQPIPPIRSLGSGPSGSVFSGPNSRIAAVNRTIKMIIAVLLVCSKKANSPKRALIIINN